MSLHLSIQSYLHKDATKAQIFLVNIHNRSNIPHTQRANHYQKKLTRYKTFINLSYFSKIYQDLSTQIYYITQFKVQLFYYLCLYLGDNLKENDVLHSSKEDTICYFKHNLLIWANILQTFPSPIYGSTYAVQSNTTSGFSIIYRWSMNTEMISFASSYVSRFTQREIAMELIWMFIAVVIGIQSLSCRGKNNPYFVHRILRNLILFPSCYLNYLDG